MNIIELPDTLRKELGLYHKEIIEAVNNETTKAMSRLVKETKQNAPVGKRKKHYKDKISSTVGYKSETSMSKIWYVKAPDYRLTHLLINGHATRDGGRVQGKDFLSPIVESVQQEYLNNIEEKVCCFLY